NSWEIPGWGLDRAAYRSLVDGTFAEGRRVFVVSSQWPFFQFNQGDDGRQLYRSERFPLAGGRWIYELKPLGETGTAASRLAVGASGAVRLNVRARDALATPGVPLIDQFMDSYGADWLEADQLFVGFKEPGARAWLSFDVS